MNILIFTEPGTNQKCLTAAGRTIEYHAFFFTHFVEKTIIGHFRKIIFDITGIFIPFDLTIHMVDGRAFRVAHPDFVAQSPSGRTVVVFQTDETYSVLDLLLVSELEVHAPDGRAA